MRFVVYDADTEGSSQSVFYYVMCYKQLDLSKQDLIGEVNTDLPSLVHSIAVKKLPIIRNEKTYGEMVVKCEELQQSCGDFKITLAGKDVVSNTFVEISNILYTILYMLPL